MTRYIELKKLPDSGLLQGKCRIHLFVLDPKGPIVTPRGMMVTPGGRKPIGGQRGRLGCLPRQARTQEMTPDGGVKLVLRSEDPRAVTCPECKALASYHDALEAIRAASEQAVERSAQEEAATNLAQRHKSKGA